MMASMKRVLAWLAAWLLAASPAMAATTRRAVDVGGRRRTYWLTAPASARPPAPLIIALHGHGGTGRAMRRLTGLDALAEQGALIAYPDGTGWRGLPPLSWNAGGCCGYAQAAGVDDIAFLRALIADVDAAVPVDRRRVFVTGISNGAMLAHRAGCEMADAVAAIGPVAGTLSIEPCRPSQPVSVLAIHGTADGYVPYAGGRGADRRDAREDLAAPEAVARWAHADGCGAVDQSRQLRGAPEPVAQLAYACPDGIAVSLITIAGGRHAWPGGRRSWRFGDAPSTLPANDLLWDFFESHRR